MLCDEMEIGPWRSYEMPDLPTPTAAVGAVLNELQSMRMTLHGAHRIEVSGATFYGCKSANSGCTVIIENLQFNWIDVGDFHPGISTDLPGGGQVDDSAFAQLSQLFPRSGDFDISIKWSDSDIYLRVPQGGSSGNIIHGWPKE